MKRSLDWPFVAAYILAGAISCAVLFSISPDRLNQQLLSFGIGLAMLIYLSKQESGIYTSVGWVTYGLTLLMLVATALFGENVRGSVRWINIAGFQFQGSEFTKPLLMLSFAHFLSYYPVKDILSFGKNILCMVIPALLIFRQPDLGTALVVGVMWLAAFLVSGPRPIFTVGLAIFGLSAILIAPRFLHDYQLRRLTSFVDPSQDPLGSGYNVIQSVIAVGSGGILGKGLGHGTQSHLRFLPERHTDFIFASLAEELGLIGALAVVTILALIMYRLLRLMLQIEHGQERLILAGVFAFFCFQTFVNIGMNIGIAPVTGITLPLVSYGGSSVIATGAMLGIASSIARGRRREESIEIR